jgi:predicted ArsR family transcriptional regulator
MSEQLPIEFVSRRARRSDPETSKKAAEKAERFAGTHKGKILAALKEHGPLTAKQLSSLIDLTVVQIARRLPELEELGHVAVAKLDDGADRVVDGFRVRMAT